MLPTDASHLTNEEKQMILNRRKQEMLTASKHKRVDSRGGMKGAIRLNLNLDLSKVENKQPAFSPSSHFRNPNDIS